MEHLPVNVWRVVACLRMGCLPLEVETGRYTGTPYEQRICKLCRSAPEDQEHFLPGEDLFVFMWSVSWCTLERVLGEDSFVFMWSVSWCTLERVPGEDPFVFMWSVSWCTLERVPGEDPFVFMWSVSWCTLERVPGEDLFVFMWSVSSWCTLKRVPGVGLSCCLYVVCPLVHPEKGPRGRLVCLCSLSPGAF